MVHHAASREIHKYLLSGMDWLFPVMILVAIAEFAHGARILAFVPMPAPSHHAVIAPVLRRLAENGHSITAVTPFRLESPPTNYTEIMIPNIFPDIFKGVDWMEIVNRFPLTESFSIFEMGVSLQEMVCNLEPVKNLISSDLQFDAVILESFFAQESFAALQHKFGAIALAFSPCGDFFWSHELAGSPYNPSFMVDFKSPFTDRMNFAERSLNALNAYGASLLGHYYYLPKVQRIADSCLNYDGWETRPPLTRLLANMSVVVHNTHNSLNYPDPLAPHFIEVGGINIRPNKPLPKNIQDFMDGATDGVIYFSLGSNIKVSSVAKDNVFNAFYSSFKKLKQRVLWKWEEKSFPDKPENIFISNWFPQQDILLHKNCRLFITHGGYLSLSEAVYHGVPIIGIPFFGDQPKNMKHVEAFGYGLRLNFDNITEESVMWAIQEVLNNDSYQKAMEARSILFRDRPMSALDTAVYWIEYAIRHKGAPHLRSSLADLPWYKAMLVDVSALVVAVTCAVMYAIYTTIRLLVGVVFGRILLTIENKQKKS